MNRQKLLRTLIKYGITAAVGGLMVYLTLTLHGFAELPGQVDRYRVLADAFTIPGVVLMLVAALVAVANEGAFTGVSYSLTWMIRTLIPLAALKNGRESYRDYVERKRANRVKGYSFLFFTGLAFFTVAIVFTVLFYRVYQ